jgi:hypothetical protein
MKREAAPQGRIHQDEFIVATVQDAVARLVFIQEAISDAEPAMAYTVARDLELDLRRVMAEMEAVR